MQIERRDFLGYMLMMAALSQPTRILNRHDRRRLNRKPRVIGPDFDDIAQIIRRTYSSSITRMFHDETPFRNALRA